MKRLFVVAFLASAFFGTAVAQGDVNLIGSWVTGLTHAQESGNSRALVFIAHGELAGDMNLVSVTYGGQAMTKLFDYNYNAAGGYAYAAAFILKEAGVAAASSGTFTPTWSSEPTEIGYASAFFSNVDQTTSTGATGTGGSTSNPVTTSALSTTNGDMVILAATCGMTGSYTLNNGFTEGIDQQMASSTGVTGHKKATGAAETPSATYSGTINRQMIIGFVVQVVPVRTLTASSTTGGDVTIPGEGAFQYIYGTQAGITATAEPNYHFTSWTGTGVTYMQVADPCSATTTVNMIGNYTVIANFAAGVWTITATADANGSVDPNGVITAQDYSDLMFTALPDVNYTVDTWYLDGNSIQTGGSTYMLTSIRADHTVEVTFRPSIKYVISGNVTCEGAGVKDVNMLGLGVVTDVNGFYSSQVEYGWSGVVTPAKIEYAFDPNGRSYTSVASDRTDQNYSAVPSDNFNDNRRGGMWRNNH
jgi:hypothetical protein